MPAVVRCPNGCKLSVPVRKLAETNQCPKCDAIFSVSIDQLDEFQANSRQVLQGFHAEEEGEVDPAVIIFLEGESTDLLTDLPSPSKSTPPPIPTTETATPHKVDPSPDSKQDERPIPSPGDAVPVESSDHPIPDVHFPEPTPLPASLPTPKAPKESPGPDAKGGSVTPSHPVGGSTSAGSTSSGSAFTAENLQPPIPPLPAGLAAGVPMGELLQDDEGALEQGSTSPQQTEASTHAKAGDRIPLLLRWLDDKENPGVHHNREIRWKAYSLSWAMVVIGIFLIGPVIYTMLQWIGKDYHLPLGRWSFLLIFFAAFQLLYGFFLFQIPDWTTTRFVSYLMLVMTVFSSCLLAVALLSQGGNGFFDFLELSVLSKGRVAGWLAVMSIIFGLMSYLCGRTTQTWIREESRRTVSA